MLREAQSLLRDAGRFSALHLSERKAFAGETCEIPTPTAESTSNASNTSSSTAGLREIVEMGRRV